jgi:hypothetical protein
MSRENTVHDFDDHGLRGGIHTSRFSYIGDILKESFYGEFYSESSATPVKLGERRQWENNHYRKNFMHGGHERATVELLFFLYRKNDNSVGQVCSWEKVHGRVLVHVR